MKKLPDTYRTFVINIHHIKKGDRKRKFYRTHQRIMVGEGAFAVLHRARQKVREFNEQYRDRSDVDELVVGALGLKKQTL